MASTRSCEESAPLLDIEQQSAPRMSEETNPYVDDPIAADDGDDASSKESRHDSQHGSPGHQRLPSASPSRGRMTALQIFSNGICGNGQFDGLPAPVTAATPPNSLASHVLMVFPKFVMTLMWFGMLCTWAGLSVFYLACWVLMQLFTGFTRVKVDKLMVRRDLGGFFNALMDMFERIW